MSHFYADVHTARIQEVIRRLVKEILTEHVSFEATFAVTPEPVPYAERQKLAYRPIAEGAHWGSTWDCGWFHIKSRVPVDWKGAAVVAQLDFAGETLVYDASRMPVAGLTSGSVFDLHYSKDILHLYPCCAGGESVELWLETGSNGLFGVNRPLDPAWEEDPSKHHGHQSSAVMRMRLCRFNTDAWHLWLDLGVLINLAELLKDGTARKLQILRGCSKALDLLPTRGPSAVREALKPLFSLPTDPATVDVYGVGHAHIDTAWLWPVRETIRKCGRTFSSQIANIERYPGYVFGASQAQLYAFTKDNYPLLYAKIKKAVKAGRWEIQGGMWVEGDCDLTGGEALVRQFIHGKNFCRDEFGVDVKGCWIPDVFGYAATMPQILNRSGIEWFLTQKISWNQ
ncbi:MAG: alpha-mannosidase 2c1, partial [bacterium]